MRRLTGMVLAAVLCLAVDVHAAPATTRPATATSQPATATSQPATATSQPATATSQPATATSQPATATTRPATATSQPATATATSKASPRPSKKELADAHAFLQSLLRPRNLTPKDKARIKKLIADLGHNDWQTREKVTEDLSRVGQEALPMIHAAAQSKDPEVVMRVELIVRAIEARVSDVGGELNPVIDTLTAARDKRLVGVLVELLTHASVGPRYAAEYGLRRITGMNFGYSASGDVAGRGAPVEKWRKWWKENEAKFSFEKIASEAKQFGLLICDGSGRTLTAATPSGKVVWTRKITQTVYGVSGLPNGNILVAYSSGKRMVEELDRDFKSVWNADKVSGMSGGSYDVHRLANGNTLIVYLQRGNVMEVSRAGKIVWQKTGLKYPISARRLANGNTLICEYSLNRVIEVNRAGNVVWQKADLKNPCDAQKLANGNVLIGTGGKRVVEVNRAGKVVWERKCSNRVIGVCRLPDGTTGIFIHGQGAILVGRGGKTVRQVVTSTASWGRIRIAPAAVLNRK